MKVLLINPPAENEILSCNPEIIKEERGFDPPLGLLYLAGYLKKNSNHELKIIDAQVDRLNYETLKTAIKEFCPEVIGITAMTFTLIDVLKTVQISKEACPEVKIVLGGPHIFLYPEETINLKGIDFLVVGEGEEVFLKLLDNINDPEQLRQVRGLVFKSGAEIIKTESQDFFLDLDQLPFLPRQLLPYKKYYSLLAKGNISTTMFTSRGCPYQCSFCDRPSMGKRFRSRSAENVVDEMEQCIKMGINEIFIYDDTFTVDRQRVFKICEEILKRGLKFSWDIRARVDTVDEDMLKLLKKAGCARIHYGVEAGTEKILKVLNKGITLDQALKTFSITKKLGISTLGYFMIGSPTETKEDILETIKFAKKLKADFIQFTLLTPFPGTRIYQKAIDEGVFENDYWRDFAKNPQAGFKTKYWTRELTADELKELLVLAYKTFYLRPGYIIKQILKIRSFKELWRKMSAGINVIKMKKDAI